MHVTSRKSPTNYEDKRNTLLQTSLKKKKMATVKFINKHLVKKAGGGPGWRTFNSFCDTQIVKEFARF